MNSVSDLIVFNDHQYTKSSPAVAVAPTPVGLPPLSIEEALNDNHGLMVPDQFSQDLSQNGSYSESVYCSSSIGSSDEHLLGDNYLDFSLEQPDPLLFGY